MALLLYHLNITGNLQKAYNFVISRQQYILFIYQYIQYALLVNDFLIILLCLCTKKNTTFQQESSIFVVFLYFAVCQVLPEPDISPVPRLSIIGFALFKIGLNGL